MPITFGSVGDIISVSLLIKDLIRCLDNSRGSSAEYQAMIRELRSLDHALLEVEQLLRVPGMSSELSSIAQKAENIAEQCHRCIMELRNQTKGYSKSLGEGGPSNLVRKTSSRLKWCVSGKENLTNFRAAINSQYLSLNILLSTANV